ncbi:Hypothetical predicted protein [Mytilus galloprovincialis]|uniref:NAD(+)--protein-arginine ADP-ribosyltransferase n=1 Tax=Mytilus galloprovincialis TaxID=29158 RepID=A0A8B6GSH4_MYTGA|nr:Hypothetical predicted protein [Mytilus galloprovincialis]
MGVISSTTNGIEEESTKVKEMVFSARQGKWDTVFSILKSNPHLMNAIPEGRRWGVLHQAVWWNKLEVLQKLLSINSCDSRVRTKETMSEVGETGGCTPYEISQIYGYTDMGKLLEQHSNTLTTENQLQDLPTFHYQISDVQLSDLGLLRTTLASYRQTFCPFTINNDKPLSGVMEEIFKHVNSNENWSTVKAKLCDSLYPVCKPAFEILKATKTKEELYAKIVNVYTNENTKLYIYLNNALRRQEERLYRPTANDLGLGPYILMFHLLLMYWNELIPETGITYRRIIVKDTDCRRYQKGAQFVWLSFITSSVDLANAEPFPLCVPKGKHKIIFVFNNETPSRWQPRNIEKYAEFVEGKRVYPAGVEFIVTERLENDDTTEVRLELSDRQLTSAQTPFCGVLL